MLERVGLFAEDRDARHIVVEQGLQHADQRRRDGPSVELGPQQRAMHRIVSRANVEEGEMWPGA
jgi:hypothetical protein